MSNIKLQGDVSGTGSLTIAAPNTDLDRVLTLPDETGTVVTTNSSSIVPSGAVFHFASSTAPAGFLECDGAAVSRTTYASLFAICGTTYGVGDGSTTFNLPDLRGEFIRGWDNGKGTDSGRTFGSTQADELKSHLHVTYGTAHGTYAYAGSSAWGTTSTNYAKNTSSTGGAETRPVNVALLPCIKT